MVETFAPEGFGLTEEQAHGLTDDAMGRALDHLFDADRGSRFVTVMPRRRLEDKELRAWIQDHEPEWEKVWDRENPRRKGGPRDRWFVWKHHLPSQEGWPETQEVVHHSFHGGDVYRVARKDPVPDRKSVPVDGQAQDHLGQITSLLVLASEPGVPGGPSGRESKTEKPGPRRTPPVT